MGPPRSYASSSGCEKDPERGLCSSDAERELYALTKSQEILVSSGTLSLPHGNESLETGGPGSQPLL